MSWGRLMFDMGALLIVSVPVSIAGIASWMRRSGARGADREGVGNS